MNAYCLTLNNTNIAIEKKDIKHLHISVYPNDIVLDPFMGSGTTGLACKNLERNFIGIESEKEYFQTAQKRLNLF
ncbi:DNA methyltransferase [Helicobacter pylori]|uniref:DNA methyltransferase n=1 Tax=Helicobacter pylori TaxID=210 RepID=UPI0024B8A756|nr:site-specific DNA-methyltransferase [Helicobacter pylori]